MSVRAFVQNHIKPYKHYLKKRITTNVNKLSDKDLKITKPPGSPEQLFPAVAAVLMESETAEVQRPAVFTHGMDSWQKNVGQEPVHIMLRNE